MAIADLDRALDASERVLIDSSTIIAMHSPSEVAHAPAAHIFARVADANDPLRGYYSFVSAAEVLVRPIRTSHERFTFMHMFLDGFPNLTGLPFDMMVAVQTATLQATMNLRLADAAIVASGLLSGCDAIITNDERWKRRGEPLFPRFKWLYLSDYA